MNDFLNYHGPLSQLSNRDLKQLFYELKSYQLRKRETFGVPQNTSFGVEIEFEGVELEKVKEKLNPISDYRGFIVHKDDSVSTYDCDICYGGEISSDILHDKKEDLDKLYQLFLLLKEMGAMATSKTGFHIHVGTQIYGEEILYLKRLVKVWCIYEEICFRFGYGESSNPRGEDILIFAPPLAPTYRALYQKNRKIFDQLTTTKTFDFGKRNAIAFHNYRYLTGDEEVNNTIEIRCPNGSMNPLIAENTIYFFLKLLLYVTSPMYDELFINRLFGKIKPMNLEDYSQIYLKKALQFSDLIFSTTKEKLDFLKQYVKDEEITLR